MKEERDDAIDDLFIEHMSLLTKFIVSLLVMLIAMFMLLLYQTYALDRVKDRLDACEVVK